MNDIKIIKLPLIKLHQKLTYFSNNIIKIYTIYFKYFYINKFIT